jgi:hypothetical protein
MYVHMRTLHVKPILGAENLLKSSKMIIIILTPGPIPTIVCYNASTVESYNTTSNLMRFDNKNNFSYFETNAIV